MRRFLAALALAVGIGCGGSLPPAETAQLVIRSSVGVLELVAELLAELDRVGVLKCEATPTDDGSQP